MASYGPWLDKFEDDLKAFDEAWEGAKDAIDDAQRDGYERYGDNIASIGIVGLAVYLLSKAVRFFNIIVRGRNAGSETVDDTILDIATYAMLTVAYRRMQHGSGTGDPAQTS